MKQLLVLLLITVMLLSLTACSGGGDDGFSAGGDFPNADLADGGAADALPEASWSKASRSGSHSGGSSSQTAITAGTLTAGEWRDNDNFGMFTELLRGNWSHLPARWQLNPTERVTVRVTGNGNPVRNAAVSLLSTYTDSGNDVEFEVLWSARTNHNGIAYLFHNKDRQSQVKPTHVSVQGTAGNPGKTVEITSDFIEFELSDIASPARTLDLMFVIDTTGSMGDELRYLQKELEDVISRVKSNNAQLPTRLSVNFYRDHGDEYVLLPHEFTTDIEHAANILKNQRADGGGDWPEALDEALQNAVFERSWAESSVKLMFVVLDAPGHHRSDAIENFNEAVRGAAEQGIRIIPIIASGSGGLEYDICLEFKMRSAAVMTGGTYTFLTGDSGVGDPHTAPTIGEFKVEKLNDLLVRIIGEYLV
jgi:hypothetical protein